MSEKNPYDTNLSEIIKIEPYLKEDLFAKYIEQKKNQNSKKKSVFYDSSDLQLRTGQRLRNF